MRKDMPICVMSRLRLRNMCQVSRQKKSRNGGHSDFFNHENKILLFSQKVFYVRGFHYSFLESVGSSLR